MKKKWIITLFLAFFVCTITISYADCHEKVMKWNEMPREIQQFINTHFTGVKVSKACRLDKGRHKVELTNGYEVEFDRNGVWREIENELHATLPVSVVALLPEYAVRYIGRNYPGWTVYNINHTSKGYEVKLRGPYLVELYFDSSGNFIKHEVDD